jgi:hypothetical protein
MRKAPAAAASPRKTMRLNVVGKKKPENDACEGKEGLENEKSAAKRVVPSGGGGIRMQTPAKIHQIGNVKHHFLTSPFAIWEPYYQPRIFLSSSMPKKRGISGIL